jgi:phenylalanyl-tRNA synthetase beta chain
MRRSLLPGLVQAASRNLSRGFSNLALIEEGSVFLDARSKGMTVLPVGNLRPSAETLQQLNDSIPLQPRQLAGVAMGDWTEAKLGIAGVAAGYPQMVDAVAQVISLSGAAFELVQAEIPGLHPGRAANVLVAGTVVGRVGELHPDIALENHLPRRVGVFELNLDQIFSLAPAIVLAGEVNPMPAATQDISLLVAEDIPAATIAKTLVSGAGELLEEIKLTDDYRGQGIAAGKKSLTFALRFRAKDRTLTQAEATVARDAAVLLATNNHGAELRSL